MESDRIQEVRRVDQITPLLEAAECTGVATRSRNVMLIADLITIFGLESEVDASQSSTNIVNARRNRIVRQVL
jgi:hypothetical protein